MKVLLINPPYQTLTSNFGVGHQIPFGLLMVGGPLLDAGHSVQFLDAECRRLTLKTIVREVRRLAPQVVMTGHAGSTPAHPICMQMLRAVKAACPNVVTVYGGVYPTYHAEQILAQEPAVDFIVRGEGEATGVRLLNALQTPNDNDLEWTTWAPLPVNDIPGIAFRASGLISLTPEAPPILNLDAFRIGWELIQDWDDYGCFGLGRAAIIQFSRGCPHRCTYCGQHGFWVQWRYRDPVKLADEIERLYRAHHITFFTLADENPTTLQTEWRRFLEEMSVRRLPVYFFATIRATDIVRDAEFLHLYRQAGVLYVLMGIESTNDRVLKEIRKRSTTRDDFMACQLLKQHGIFSILGLIVGFQEETWDSFRTAMRQLIYYDGSYLNAMYVTPHAWTPFGKEMQNHRVIQLDQRRWDYRHQILSQRHLKPWQLFVAVKWLELCYHLRPQRLAAILRERDRLRFRQWLWTYLHVGLVWIAEVVEFLVGTSFVRHPVTVSEAECRSETFGHIPNDPEPSLNGQLRSRPEMAPIRRRAAPKPTQNHGKCG